LSRSRHLALCQAGLPATSISGMSCLFAVMLFAFAAVLLAPSAANAGDIGMLEANNTGNYSQGDCWRAGSPTLCVHTFWTSSPYVYLWLNDQGLSAMEHRNAATAASNWTSYQGPQYFSYYHHANESWIFQSRRTLAQYPNIGTVNCDVNNNCPGASGTIWYSQMFVDPDTDYCGDTEMVHLWAHEMGHALGLAHHGSEGSSRALMTQQAGSGVSCYVIGTPFTSPGSNELGSKPNCPSGGTRFSPNDGVRCIYNYPG
jgi:hypothetical protein